MSNFHLVGLEAYIYKINTDPIYFIHQGYDSSEVIWWCKIKLNHLRQRSQISNTGLEQQGWINNDKILILNNTM